DHTYPGCVFSRNRNKIPTPNTVAQSPDPFLNCVWRAEDDLWELALPSCGVPVLELGLLGSTQESLPIAQPHTSKDSSQHILNRTEED
ncbi:hypothetical protein STEG23_004907, partial [Scotinomys teguina]